MKRIIAAICFNSAITLMVLLAGCGGGGKDSAMSGSTVLYSGSLYGDFLDIYAAVKSCKGYQGDSQPSITIYASTFDCSGVSAGGCYSNGHIAWWGLPMRSVTIATMLLILTGHYSHTN